MNDAMKYGRPFGGTRALQANPGRIAFNCERTMNFITICSIHYSARADSNDGWRAVAGLEAVRMHGFY